MSSYTIDPGSGRWPCGHPINDMGCRECARPLPEMPLDASPITQLEAKLFIGLKHRHLKRVTGGIVSVSIRRGGELVGAAMFGRPVASKTQNSIPGIAEVVRAAVIPGVRGGNSKLYKMCATIAREQGYWAIQTFTIESESGVSLRAAGFILDRPASEDEEKKPNQHGKYRIGRTLNLFGEPEIHKERKNRWVRILGKKPRGFDPECLKNYCEAVRNAP